MDPNWAQITTAVGAAVTALAATVALRQLREARHVRMAQTLVEWHDAWNRELREEKVRFAQANHTDLEELVRQVYTGKLDRGRLEKLFAAEAIPNWLEGIAILQREHGVSLSLIERYWGDVITELWGKWQPAAQEIRRYEEGAYQELEDLVERLRRRRLWRQTLRGVLRARDE
jgi:hypothetical protein